LIEGATDSDTITRLISNQADDDLNINLMMNDGREYLDRLAAQASNAPVKLPTITLPTFTGEITEWDEFWDQFCSSVDRREINPVDKFVYLRGECRQTNKWFASRRI
jgi:hypothetical protein